METGESPWQAVVREVIEEVGLQIQVERVLGIYSVPERGDLVFTFLCVPVGGVILTSEEADEVRWFTRNTIPSNTSRRQLERIEDAYANSIPFASPMPNKALQPTVPPPLRFGSTAAELGRLGVKQPNATLSSMSRADWLKEEIGWLKVAFGIAVALDASLVAWLPRTMQRRALS